MKKHVYEIDFIRTVCCIGIIIYHFACHTNSELSILTKTVNSDLGSVLVTVFFMISGFVLFHNNQEIKPIKVFYWKRFKSIFPSFWLCWAIFYLFNVLKVKTPFYAGNPVKLLFTLIGQDGYFGQRIVTYYTVGEWFLGALIIVYLLYPVLLSGYKKNKVLTLIFLITLVTIVKTFNIPVISPGFPGISECCLKLYLGILVHDYINEINKPSILILIAYVLIYSVVKINKLNWALDMVLGICCFILLFKFGTIVTKNNKMNSICRFVGGISYQVFLLQHTVINYVFELCNPEIIVVAVLVMIVCIAITIIFALLINLIIKRILNTKMIKKFENSLLLSDK